jgi:hypothetical protein
VARKLASSQPNHSPCFTSAFASTKAAPERPYDALPARLQPVPADGARTRESPPPGEGRRATGSVLRHDSRRLPAGVPGKCQ